MTENTILNSILGKTITSVKTGWCGMDNEAICIGFADCTFVTFTGEHSEKTAVILDDAIDDERPRRT